MQEQLAEAIKLRKAERYDEARAILNDLLAAHPDNPRLHYEVACFHDSQGSEQAAIPHYEQALANGLDGEELRGAYLGLGSSYRCIGAYQQAADTLRQGMERFPDAGEFPAFLALALYNLGRHAEAVSLLVRTLAQTSSDSGIMRYQGALLFYHDKLDEIWLE